MTPGQKYALYGWTTDNSSSAAPVVFTVEDLASLRPGQVMYDDGSDRPTVIDEATLRPAACKLVNGS